MLNSLNEPTRCRNHSRATKIGALTWKRKALCSNGVPCRSRSRKRTSPRSESSISSLRRAKLTRAALTTERSLAIASSRRTKPWSSTVIVFSGMTSGMTATGSSVTGLYVGTSGFSFPTWKGGFYPADAKPADFLRLYAEPLLAEARAVRVNDLDADAPFRYVRFRDPPYDEPSLTAWAERLAPLARVGIDVYGYFKHEDEPTAPRYAEQLLALATGAV